MDVAVYFPSPVQKPPEVVALMPHELPELQKTDLGHLDAAVGLDPPQEVRTAPGSEAMAARGIPQEAEHVSHAVAMIAETQGGGKILFHGQTRMCADFLWGINARIGLLDGTSFPRMNANARGSFLEKSVGKIDP
jgi:hypothetical protein